MTDGCTMSAKKDALVNIGGFFCCNDERYSARHRTSLSSTKACTPTADSPGVTWKPWRRAYAKRATEEHMAARIGQVRYLGRKLEAAGVPDRQPIGSHAIFIDARRFLPHIDQDDYPAQALAAELFIEAGIRTMERGNVSAGRSPITG